MPWLVKNKNDSLVHTGIGNHKYIDKYRDRNGNWQYIYETRVGEGDKSDTTDHVGPNHKSPTGPSSDVARYTDKTSDTSTTKGHGNTAIGVYKRTAAENAKHLQEVRSNMLRNRPTYKNGIPDNATGAREKAEEHARQVAEAEKRNKPTGVPANATQQKRDTINFYDRYRKKGYTPEEAEWWRKRAEKEYRAIQVNKKRR